MTQMSVEMNQEWWQAVRSIAALVAVEGIEPKESNALRSALERQGFSRDGIHKALEWLDRAALSGHLMDSLGMLQAPRAALRVEHPLEHASLHPVLWSHVMACRARGFLTDEVAERLIEGLRILDTREWEADDLEEFVEDVLMAAVTPSDVEAVRHLLGGSWADSMH